MLLHHVKSIQAYFQKNLSVYVHEIAFDIHLQYIGSTGIVQGNRADMMLKSPYRVLLYVETDVDPLTQVLLK